MRLRLIALHINKAKDGSAVSVDRTDYSENAAKTEDGNISAYARDAKTCDEEFRF